jgi:hypothetical protein
MQTGVEYLPVSSMPEETTTISVYKAASVLMSHV